MEEDKYAIIKFRGHAQRSPYKVSEETRFGIRFCAMEDISDPDHVGPKVLRLPHDIETFQECSKEEAENLIPAWKKG